MRTNKLPIAGTPKTNIDIARTSLRALAAPHVISKGWPTGAGNHCSRTRKDGGIIVKLIVPKSNLSNIVFDEWEEYNADKSR